MLRAEDAPVVAVIVLVWAFLATLAGFLSWLAVRAVRTGHVGAIARLDDPRGFWLITVAVGLAGAGLAALLKAVTLHPPNPNQF
jgi:hypothetical protein